MTTRPLARRAAPYALFAAFAMLGLALATILYDLAAKDFRARLNQDIDDLAHAIDVRTEQDISLLRATRAVVMADSRSLDPQRFHEFASLIDLVRAYHGLRGLGFAPIIATGAEPALERAFGLPRVWPDTDQPLRAPVAMLEPRDARNQAALGFDMYGEARRRKTMQAAQASDAPRATPPVQLAQEIDSDVQKGFLIYLPTRAGPADARRGFVYAAFRAADFLSGAAGEDMWSTYGFALTDVDETDNQLLTMSPKFKEDIGNGAINRFITVAGRQWRLSVALPNRWQGGAALPAVVAVLIGALTLAGLFSRSFRLQLQSEEKAQALTEIQQRLLDEREVLLHEMTHRIKNSIARIAGMARGAARDAANLDEFSESFFARLDAMAAAQDALTRSVDAHAALETILTHEIAQLFEEGDPRVSISGPPVAVGGRQAQAFALIFHELATNAVKYGAARDDAGTLAISWRRTPAGGLDLDWVERSPTPVATPGRTGFGSRLIDMMATADLKGEVTREMTPTGLHLRLSIGRL